MILKITSQSKYFIHLTDEEIKLVNSTYLPLNTLLIDSKANSASNMAPGLCFSRGLLGGLQGVRAEASWLGRRLVLSSE